MSKCDISVGYLFMFVSWTVLLFVYFIFSEVTQLFKNVSIKGSEPVDHPASPLYLIPFHAKSGIRT